MSNNPIIIPSKMILSKRIDPIVRNNIGLVELSLSEVEKTNEKDTTIGEMTSTSFVRNNIEKLKDVQTKTDSSSGTTIAGTAYVDFYDPILFDGEVVVKILQKNKKVVKISDSLEDWLDVKIYGEKRVYNVTAPISTTETAGTINTTIGDIKKASLDYNDSYWEIAPSSAFSELIWENYFSVSASVRYDHESNAGMEINDIIYDYENGVIRIPIKRIVGSKRTILSKKYTLNLGSYEGTISGRLEEYIPSQIVVSVFGDTISYEINSVNSKIGVEEKTSTSLDVEGIVFTSNFAFTYDGKRLEHSTYLANNILDFYKNGKQVVDIECAMGDYYDKDGNLVITTKDSANMLFKNGDVILPYQFGADGTEKPFSTDSKGNPVEYIIVSRSIKYTGTLRQKIVALEKTT